MKSARISVKLTTGEVLVADEISVETYAREARCSPEVAETQIRKVLDIFSNPARLDSMQVTVNGVQYNLNPNHVLWVVVTKED